MRTEFYMNFDSYYYITKFPSKFVLFKFMVASMNVEFSTSFVTKMFPVGKREASACTQHNPRFLASVYIVFLSFVLRSQALGTRPVVLHSPECET